MDVPQPRVLGETAAEFTVERGAALREVTLDLARQSRHTVDIASRHLDPLLYDNEEFAEAIKAVALGSRRAQIRLLVSDPAPLVRQGHRLLALASRLTSFISLRIPAPEHKDFDEAWLVGDNKGYAYRRFSDRFEATINFSDSRRAVQLWNRFEELWQRASPDPNLRRLHL